MVRRLKRIRVLLYHRDGSYRKKTQRKVKWVHLVCAYDAVEHTCKSKENKLAFRNFESPQVHLKHSNEPEITTKITTQMPLASVLTSQQQLLEIIIPASSSLRVFNHQVSGHPRIRWSCCEYEDTYRDSRGYLKGNREGGGETWRGRRQGLKGVQRPRGQGC